MNKIRVATLLFPPLGMIMLWRAGQLPLRTRIIGTFAVLLYSLLYAGGIVALLMLFAGLELEWRGGFPPVLTWNKTHTDYSAVEASRRRQSHMPQKAESASAAADWPGFRGPHRDGQYDHTPIATNWPAAGLPALWKQPIGGGYASFAVAGGRAFTIEQRRELETVTCYDVETGRELWACGYPADFDEMMGGEGPRATPYCNEGKVYSLGAMGDLLCLDAETGKVLWKLNILTDNFAPVPYYGMAGSPLVVDDKVIVEAGGVKGHAIAAYDKKTGKPIWRALDDLAAYSSTMLMTIAGAPQLLAVTENRAVGLNLKDGGLLWMTPWIVKEKNRNNSQPIQIGANQFMLSAGYGTGSEAVEVSLLNGRYEARPVWHTTALKNKFSSSVYWHGFVYGLDEDMLACLDAQTGQRKWKDGRYGYGQVVMAQGYLIVLGGEGRLALVRANPDHWEELGGFQALAGKTWNHPALASGKILVRNGAQMACYDLRPK